MAIVLDGITLSGSLLWVDKRAFSPVAQSVRRTLGGGLVVFSKGLDAGRPVTLEATEDSGWLTATMVDSLTAMAASPGAVYAFSYHGEAFNVVFRHDEPPAMDMRPLQPRATVLPGDFFVGTIKLLTV